MIRFNRRGWMLSIRVSQLADIDPALRPAALALQAALIADGIVDSNPYERLDGDDPRQWGQCASRQWIRHPRLGLRRLPPRQRQDAEDSEDSEDS
jgi:hypothetical protein